MAFVQMGLFQTAAAVCMPHHHERQHRSVWRRYRNHQMIVLASLFEGLSAIRRAASVERAISTGSDNMSRRALLHAEMLKRSACASTCRRSLITTYPTPGVDIPASFAVLKSSLKSL